MLEGMELIGRRVGLNVLAADADNAREVAAAAGVSVLLGVMTKGRTVAETVSIVERCQQFGVPVSVGLGAGDPNQYKAVMEVAGATGPTHVNQVYPAAGYTIGLLKAWGHSRTVVNALISPTGRPGWVNLSTGPQSAGRAAAVVPVQAAAALLADAGIPSVKFFPVNGAWEELRAMARAAAEAGIPVMEPTGGLDESNVAEAVHLCLEAGSRIVVPHVYSAVIDRTTGKTTPERVAELVAQLKVVAAGA